MLSLTHIWKYRDGIIHAPAFLNSCIHSFTCIMHSHTFYAFSSKYSRACLLLFLFPELEQLLIDASSLPCFAALELNAFYVDLNNAISSVFNIS